MRKKILILKFDIEKPAGRNSAGIFFRKKYGSSKNQAYFVHREKIKKE